MTEEQVAGLIYATVAVLIMAATAVLWRRQERDRPQENFRDPPILRCVKTLLCRLGDGILMWF